MVTFFTLLTVFILYLVCRYKGKKKRNHTDRNIIVDENTNVVIRKEGNTTIIDITSK